MQQEPFPWRVFQEAGLGFTLGVAGGACFHGASAFATSPAEYRWRFIVSAIRHKAPVSGFHFATFMALYSTFDSVLTGIMGEPSPIIRILSGGMAGMLPRIRLGPQVAGLSFFGGALAFTFFEAAPYVLQWGMERMLLPSLSADSQDIPNFDGTNTSADAQQIAGYAPVPTA